MLQKIRWFLLIIGVLVVLTIALQNDQPVPLELLFFRRELPLTLLLLATSGASFVFGALTTVWMLRTRSKTAPAKPKVKVEPIESTD